MTTRLNQPSDRAEEVAAARLQRRLEREFRARAQRKRAIVLVVSLVSAGVLLLGVGGIALAARASEARGEAESTTILAEAVTQAPVELVEPSPAEAGDVEPTDDSPAVVQPDAEEPSEEPADKPAKKPAPETAKKSKPSTQRFTIDIGDFGYEPAAIKASSASPITLTVEQGEGCAAGFTIPSLGISEDNSTGPVTISLGTLEAGTYRFACAMEMVEGELVVE